MLRWFRGNKRGLWEDYFREAIMLFGKKNLFINCLGVRGEVLSKDGF